MEDAETPGGPSRVRSGSDARGEAEAHWSTKRADARRNHERVLDAAVEVFTEFGLEATVPQVAARAGVGKATVYRSYPTKADLVRAVALVHRDWLADRLQEAASTSGADAFEAIRVAVERIFERLASDRLMVDVLGGIDGMEGDVESVARFERILELGAAQSTIRPDVTSFDVHVLMTGVARALLEQGVRDPAQWRRYARLATDALRPRQSQG